MKDLIALVPDKDIENALLGILNRPRSIGIKSLSFDIFKHDQKDPGVRVDAKEFLRSFTKDYAYSLIIFDYEGCGVTNIGSVELENKITLEMENNGWANRNETVIIEPEFEAWGWIDSPNFYQNLGWFESYSHLLDTLKEAGYYLDKNGKPTRPKEATDFLLEQAKWPRSSSIYKKIASTVTLSTCRDRSFNKLLDTLRKWYSQ